MHTTKRAVLLSCSDHYNHRLYVIDGYLKSQGYETVYYTGDFDHSSKRCFTARSPDAARSMCGPTGKTSPWPGSCHTGTLPGWCSRSWSRIRRMWWWPSCPPTIWPITAPASSAATRIPS